MIEEGNHFEIQRTSTTGKHHRLAKDQTNRAIAANNKRQAEIYKCVLHWLE